jgi:hypothetical protein
MTNTNIKNSVLVINLTLLILLGAMTPINAQTSIAVQESRLDSLSDLSYQIKVSKSKVELSKSKAELAKLNNGDLDTIPNAVKPISTLLEHNNTEAVINKTSKHPQTNLIKELNTLSISAIINQRVAFKDIEGTFQQGDALGNSGIKIINITHSSVVLSTTNNLNKTITMDWIND